MYTIPLINKSFTTLPSDWLCKRAEHTTDKLLDLVRFLLAPNILFRNLRPGFLRCAQRPLAGRTFFAPRAPCAPAPLPTLATMRNRRGLHLSAGKQRG
jgi:hypothetical protein